MNGLGTHRGVRWLMHLAGALCSVGVTACGGASLEKPEVASPQVSEVTGQETCRVAQDPLHPLVVEWPGTNKTELDVLSQQGPVVVSYAGCVLKVLSGCKAGGTAGYEMIRTTPTREVVSMADENELRARLPLGVTSLKGELSKGSGLELEYVSVGQRLLRAPPTTLLNACEGATHYVQSITVGAYSLSTTASTAAKAGVDTIAADVGFAVTRKLARVRGAGEPSQCGASPDAAECKAVLQLGLVPLSFTGDKVATGGFGAGLGAVPVIPTMGALQQLSTSSSLASVDVNLLQLLQSAKRLDRDPTALPRSKAEAWKRLAAYSDANIYKEAASQRYEQWLVVIDMNDKIEAKVQAMCEQREQDTKKLNNLLSLDDDIVSAKQKDGFKREIEQVYAPWEGYFSQCTGPGPDLGLTPFRQEPSAQSHTSRARAAKPATTAPQAAPTPEERKRAQEEERRARLYSIGGIINLSSYAVLTGSIWVAVIAHSRVQDADKKCPDKRCPASYADELNKTRTLANVATVLLGTGGAALVTGIILRNYNKPTDPASTAWSLQLSPFGVGMTKDF